MNVSWEAALILLPLAGALLLFVAPRALRAVVLIEGIGMPLLAAGLIGEVLREGAYRHPLGGWGAPLGIDLRVDGLSALMVGMTALVGSVTTFYALGYFPKRGQGGAELFWPLWLFLWGALHALFLSGDAFNLYVTLELVTFSAVALTALARTDVALSAATRYLLASLAGSLSYLLGVALLYGAYGRVDLQGLGQAVTGGFPAQVAFTLMMGGLLVKTALFPFHFWLPSAHASAPAPVSAVLSALVVKGSFYMVLRLWFEVFGPEEPMGALMGVLGGGAIFWGSLQALRQKRLKLLIAYSTVAQLGYLFLLFPLAPTGGFAAWGGGLLFAFSHACGKAAMFLAAGTILHAAGHDRIDELGGVAPALLPSLVTIGLAGANLIGLPPSGGFVAKWMLLNAAFAGGGVAWALVILGGTLLSAAYTLRVLTPMFRTQAVTPLLHPPCGIQQWSAFALAVFALLFGLMAGAPLHLLGIGAPLGGPVLHGAP